MSKKALFITSSSDHMRLYSFLKAYSPNKLSCRNEILVIENDVKIKKFELRTINPISEIDVPIKSITVPFNQGYGGNQKIGFQYGIEKGFDAIVQLNSYDVDTCKILPKLFNVVLSGEADACFGSKINKVQSVLSGRTSIKYFVLNRFLTIFQNWLLGLNLRDYRPKCRIYALSAMAALPFRYNSDDERFDLEIIIQFALKKFGIKEILICRNASIKDHSSIQFIDTWHSISTAVASCMHRAGILYKTKFDIHRNDVDYESKFNYLSSHTIALEAVSERSKVLDLACGSGFLANALLNKKCQVTGIDMKSANANYFFRFILLDLDLGELPEDLGKHDYILALDCLEHLKNPELFLAELRAKYFSRKTKVICTTANIAFFSVRLGLLLGAFNYGRFGILDFTHKRLFTFKTFKQLFLQEGYVVLKIRGIPAPYPKSIGHNRISYALIKLNKLLIRIAPTLFSYQIYIEAKMKPPFKI